MESYQIASGSTNGVSLWLKFLFCLPKFSLVSLKSSIFFTLHFFLIYKPFNKKLYLALHNLRYYSMQVFWSEGFLRKCVVMDLVISTTCEFPLTNAVQWRGTQTLSDPNLFVLPEVTRARTACYSTTTQLPRLFWIVRVSLVCDSLVLSCFSCLQTDFKRAHHQFSLKHLWCTPILRAIIIISLFNILCFSPLNLTITEQCFIVYLCVREGKQQLGLNKQLYLFALGSPLLLFSFSQLPLRALAPTFSNRSMHVSHKHR